MSQGITAISLAPWILERRNQVRVELGVVTWPGEIDLAPDAMHAELAAHGEWHLPA